MSVAQEPVLLDIRDGVATITFNRPQVLNALDAPMIEAMDATLAAVASDIAARVVVIHGAGPAFMAGGDIENFRRLIGEYAGRDGLEDLLQETAGKAQKLVVAMRAMPKPIIASVHGACAGIGLGLMLACDLAIAADDTKFTLAYIHLGTTPDGGASYHLARAVGQKRAAEIALLGDRFGAADAERWGLINRAVPAAELEAATRKLATRLAAGPAAAYRRTKALLNSAQSNGLETQLTEECKAFAASALTADFTEGVSAFLEKRPPKFGSA